MNPPKKRPFYLLVLLFLFGTEAIAQLTYKVEHYSTENGLSHQAVNCMIKDREGFMWFGTWDGINRFDGHQFVSYKSSPGDMSHLENDRIDQIVEDQSDHLWLEAYDKQIYRFDKKTEQFLSLAAVIDPKRAHKVAFSRIVAATGGWVWLESANEGLYCVPQSHPSPDSVIHYHKAAAADRRLPSNRIRFFHEDSDRRIWIGTPEGLTSLERSSSGIYKINKSADHHIRGVSFTAVEEDAEYVFLGTASGELYRYEKKTRQFSFLPPVKGPVNALLRSRKRDVLYVTTATGAVATVNLRTQRADMASIPKESALVSIYEDRTGVLWIEPENQGVVRFDPFTGTFRLFSNRNPDQLNYIGNRFRVFEDNSGTVWVNLKGGGFGFYDAGNESLTLFPKSTDAVNQQFSNIVLATFYDPAGVLWLTTNERELVKVIFQANDFRQHLLVERPVSRAENEVRGLLCDNQNRLWLGAKSGQLYVYQRGKRVTGLFENEPPGGLGGVYTILQDSRGNIWLGTKANGLFKASPLGKEATRYRLTHFKADKRASNRLQSNEIYALLEDRQGRIWVGTFDEGLFLVVNDGDSVNFIHSGPAFQNYPKEGFHKIRHLALDAAGTLWIGTTSGLLLLNADDRKGPVYTYKTYSKKAGDGQSLGKNDIQFIFRDSKNRMWLATSGGGLSQAIGPVPLQSLQFRNYTTKDGLPNDYLLSCAEDRQGNLWLATENGLSKFHPDTKIFRNYDSYDGIIKASFSEAAATRLPDGQLVFGTSKGYLSFDPGRIGAYRVPATIALTNLQINNADAGPGNADIVLNSNINYLPALRLKYNQNIISIDFAMLDPRSQNRQDFAYRLKGFDTAWYEDRQQRRATYTNLPPGDYVFEVKSLSTDLYTNTPYKRLAITILPPPWKTWWAYFLYFLFTGLLVAVIRRTALTMLRLRHKIAVEQKLAALKLSFFTNVSHELRTPLTLILNPLEQLARREQLSPQGNAWVQVAHKNATRMVRFINQLLDLRKVESNKATLRVSRVEVVGFVRRIADHFTEAARNKRIDLDVFSEQKELYAWMDAEKLDVVVYNLLANALKFTPEGKKVGIHIRSGTEQGWFLIKVSDHGPGVEKEKLKDIFELFYEGEQAAGQGQKGTGIGLALSRELVVLHGGAIWAHNNEEGGLTVAVKMKLGKDHYKPEEICFVDAPETILSLERTVEQQLFGQPSHPGIPKESPASLVLLVEDNDELRTFLNGQLGEFYRVEVAANGQEGWQKALQLMPDLIVSDIMMPVMDGIQLLDQLKNDVQTSHIPVVLLSARYSVESQIEGLNYGADCYITKPFHNEFLRASIDNLLRQRKKLFEALVEKKTTVDLSPQPLVITSKDEGFLKEVVRVVEDKMADPDFNIDIVAETMAMSRTTFYKKFKSLTNLTPVEFVREMRLQRARQLLDAGGKNVSEVAYLVGFSNPKYFSTCFKEKYHVSPSDYLKVKVQ